MSLIQMGNELFMRLTEFTDEHGVKWITPHRAAEIWNERVANEYNKGKTYQNYTRFSVVHRPELKQEGNSIVLPGGRLYRETKIREIVLYPHPQWPEERKKARKRAKEAVS